LPPVEQNPPSNGIIAGISEQIPVGMKVGIC